jgi:hypothetical protein
MDGCGDQRFEAAAHILGHRLMQPQAEHAS